MRAIGAERRDIVLDDAKRVAWIRKWQAKYADRWQVFYTIARQKQVTRLVPKGEAFDEVETAIAERRR